MSLKDYNFPFIDNNNIFYNELFSGDKNIRCNKLWCSDLIVSNNPIKALLTGQIIKNVNEFRMLGSNPQPNGDLYNINHQIDTIINITPDGVNTSQFRFLYKGYYKIDWSFSVVSLNDNVSQIFISKKIGNNPSVQLGNIQTYLNQYNNNNTLKDLFDTIILNKYFNNLNILIFHLNFLSF